MWRIFSECLLVLVVFAMNEKEISTKNEKYVIVIDCNTEMSSNISVPLDRRK